jgi:hypothetical protein
VAAGDGRRLNLALAAAAASRYERASAGKSPGKQEHEMAKGQMRSNKETRKPKKEKPKTTAANPSQKGGQRGLENLKND